MGKIITLSGPSGVGKTTLFYLIETKLKQEKIKLIPRYTNRPIRKGEQEGFEYHFVTHDGLLQKVLENDFIHFEKWGDYYSAIEKNILDETIKSDYDGIVLASIFGTNRLQATYHDKIVPIYMWSGRYQSLHNRECLSPFCEEIIELKSRIRKKLVDDGFSEFEKETLANEEFLEKRMIDNYLDIAAVYGKLMSGDKYYILENLHKKESDTANNFLEYINELRKR
ncbi:nucleoside-triphosphatase [Sediminibacterium ginsengisoli]|uniref:Guanylate kinase n=1 Tax=Sediminibacterium ginsengisoli TaxID=413434 RepID=A0A1T4JP77_9BACT|nr:nucleoside-triphosphatase [Sediminibacterium ginsengisoli]SJZ32032.1 Guanylate kinase [Sediminibacterium ginsengisoli]